MADAHSTTSVFKLTALSVALLILIPLFLYALLVLRPSSANIIRDLTHSPPTLSILVGVLTFADRREVRYIHRLVRSLQHPPVSASVDVKFVFCRLTRDDQRVLVALEMMRHRDIMVVDCALENVNNGKTFAFLSAAASGRKYDYIMKTDDDTYIRFSELVEALRPLPRNDLYFGHMVPADHFHKGDPLFMAGMGYVLSWNVLQWIVGSNITKNNTVGEEDKLVGRWLRDGGRVVYRYDTKPSDAQVEEWRRGGDRIIDHKATQYDLPWPPRRFMPRTISVHRLKDNAKWAQVLRYFNVTERLNFTV